jgi:hypothetical protein
MKKIMILTAMLIGISAAGTLAEMGGGTGDQHKQSGSMMGSQQGHKMMGDQMMGQEMMRDMHGMMNQMNEMMQKMSGAMGDTKGMGHAKMMDMSEMMKDMSVTMKEMSEQMAKGQMDPAMTTQMQARMKGMTQRMENIEKEDHKEGQ